MTEAEIYEFDLNGYIVYPDMIPTNDVKMMNDLLDAHFAEKDLADSHSFAFLNLAPCFMELMAHPKLLHIMRHMIGDWLRLDHTYGLQMDRATVERGQTRPNLHGGPRTDHGEHQYQWFDGKMHNGLIVVMFALKDVNPGDGGFICVPGSHKANLNFKPEVESHLVVNPNLKAGDMLIFTEALVHGTTTWVSENQRRSLLYKYSPGHSTWANADQLIEYLPLARNDLQRDLLRPPSVGNRSPLQFPELS